MKITYLRQKNNNMQIRANIILFVVLACIVLSCTKRPNSPAINALAEKKYQYINSLITDADSLAEVNPDSSIKLISIISNYPAEGLAKKVISAYEIQIKGVAEVSKGSIKEGFKDVCTGHSLFLSLNDSLLLVESYKRQGYALREMSEYDKAIKCFIEALTISDALKSKKNVAYINNAIGLLFMRTGNYEKSISYLLEAKKLYSIQNNQFGLGKVYNNLGGTYYKLGQNILALENLEKAYEIKKQFGNNNGNLGNTINNIGLVCMQLKLYSKAIDYFSQALVQYRRNDDKWGEANTLNNLAQAYIETNLIDTAKTILENNKANVDKINAPDLKLEWYDLSYKMYAKSGNTTKALLYHIAYTNIKDSTFSQSKQKIIDEVQGKYESEKKEKEIDFLNNLRKVQESKLKMQRYIGGLMGFSFLLLVVFSFLLFRKYRTNKAEHNLLKTKQREVEEKNTILNKAMNEVELKTNQLKKQRDIAKEQMNQIHQQKEEITNSIRYAYRIQSAILESKELNRTNIPPYFTLFRPKDIVSGDFFWIRELEKYSIFAVADCTGHGVPGAFMSLLGIAFLNEIFSESQNVEPHDILNSLRAKIITALHQNSTDPINNDGMDVSLLFIDHSKKKIQFSGANHSLFIVRKYELIEINGDKMPVGFYYSMNSFATHQVDIQAGDCIYLATDGFADQFGGPDAKKFRLKGFKNLLLQIGDKPLEQQKNILECSFDAWKGNGIQMDDVLVLGIKI